MVAIKRLLAEKANVNAPFPDKSTVLSWAVDRQDPQSVDMLLAAGAKPNVADINGASPLTLACERGDPGIVASLLASRRRRARRRGLMGFEPGAVRRQLNVRKRWEC